MIGMLILDQLTKHWARTAFNEHQQPGFPFPGFLEFTLIYNQGIAFGLMKGSGILMTPIAVGIAGAALVYSSKNPGERGWTQLAMGLLAAGALGNLYDRLHDGKVTDMIYLTVINFPVFNVADACITCAAAILMITWTFEAVKPAEGPKIATTVETLENPVP